MATAFSGQPNQASYDPVGDDPLPLWQWGALFCGALVGWFAQLLIQNIYGNLTHLLFGWPHSTATLYREMHPFSGWFTNAGMILGVVAALVWGRQRRGKARAAISLALWFGLGSTLLSVLIIGKGLQYALGGVAGVCGISQVDTAPSGIHSWAAMIIGGYVFNNVPLQGSLLLLVWAFSQIGANRCNQG
jgi:hypothetical protein